MPYVIEPEKTSHTYIKYSYPCYGTYLLVCMCNTTSVIVLSFLWSASLSLQYIFMKDNKLLHFKVSKLDQFLCVDNSGPVTYQIMLVVVKFSP